MPCFQATSAMIFNVCFNLQIEHNKVIKFKIYKQWSFTFSKVCSTPAAPKACDEKGINTLWLFKTSPSFETLKHVR